MSRGPNKQFEPEVALQRAMEVFWARGYEAASLAELLQNMGISRKSMYDTFGNKQSLFLKALDQYAQTRLRSIREQLLALGSPLRNIEQLLQSMQKTHGKPGSKGCMLGTCAADFNTSDVEIAPILRSYYHQLENIYYEAISQAQAAGELNPKASARDLARMLLCTTQGMALVGRVLDRETIPQSVVLMTIEALKKI
ncbi:MAG: TetR/AcrR family transcriptional regulator [Xenococcaceae cyanobacterium MO_188.B32]|nr:TetR/AcrR family transcriptional regulator [Xenococcaceae cyanobacterium MO_188.B32]